MARSIQQKVAIGVALTFAIFCGAVTLMYNTVNDLITTREEVQESREILQALNDVMLNITDAETGQRGYLLTEKPIYLIPYTKAIHSIQQDFNTLHKFSNKDPHVQNMLKPIEALTQQKLQELSETIQTNKTQGPAAAKQIIMTDKGQQLMDSLRLQIASMENDVNTLLQKRRLKNRLNLDYTINALSISGLLIFLLLGLVYWMVNRESTQRQKAEDELSKLNKELRHNMHLLNSIIENVPGMIFLKDAENLRFEIFNKAAQEVVGYSADEVLGKSDFDFFPKEQATYFTQKDYETLKLKALVNIEEEEILTKQGDTRILRTKKVPILDQSENPLYLLGISEDITEFKRTQQYIENLNAQLQKQVADLNALNKELESFSYSVSHDLRTPLRSIDGFSQAILESAEDKLDDTEKDYLRRVRNGSQQMAQLIDDILNLSRVTRKELTIEANVDLKQIAAEIIAELQQREPARQVVFNADETIIATGDRRILQVALQNLIENAWKFTSKCNITEITFSHDLETGVYTLKDNGAGFNMAYVSKLFEAFQRLHTTVEFPGTGIGLAIVQRIIHRHGGRIWAEGEVEKGASFYFTLSHTHTV